MAESHLLRQKFQPFVPKVSVEKLWRGERIIRIRPYIPGYIFIRFDRETDRWRSINGTRGIKQLVTCGDVPTRIPDRAMNVLLEMCVDGYVKEESVDLSLKKLIPVDTTVKIKEGPFALFHGKITMSTEDRVTLLTSIFGRETEVTLDPKDVEIVT